MRRSVADLDRSTVAITAPQMPSPDTVHPASADIISPMQKVDSPFPALSEASRAVLVDLLVHGPQSRADLARRSGLSPASLTRMIRTFVETGTVSESDATITQRMGRPSQPMDVNVDLAHLIGIKLSADQFDAVSTDLRAKALTQSVVSIPDSRPDAVVAAMADHILAARAADPLVAAVGVSLAGPVSPRSDDVHTSPFLGWSEVPLVSQLAEATGLPVVVENDVRALTAAEHWFGAAAGCTDFVLVTIGAGVGCGVVVNDRLVDGVNGGSGQVGHLPISDGGPMCERGHRGCARAYLASTSITRQVSATLGRPVDYAQVLDLAAAGEPVSGRVVAEACRALGTLIGMIASVTAPAKVILSGEGVPLAANNLAQVRERAREVQHWTLPDVPIEVAPFTFTEWARGAAVIALRQQLQSAVRIEG